MLTQWKGILGVKCQLIGTLEAKCLWSNLCKKILQNFAFLVALCEDCYIWRNVGVNFWEISCYNLFRVILVFVDCTWITKYFLFSPVKDVVEKAPVVEQEPVSKLPEGVEDYDKEMENDPFAVSLYAQDIFEYYKGREVSILCNLMEK